MNPPTLTLSSLLLLGSLYSVETPATHELPTVPANPAGKVADAYLATVFGERDLDRSATLMHEDIAFIDPTSNVWPGSPAAKGLKGRDEFLKLQRSWLIEESAFDVKVKFESGPFALRAGTISWRARGAKMIADRPFVIVLKVDGERVRTRTDFGDYDELVPGVPKNGEALEAIGAEYLEAYAAFDFESMDGLFGDEVAFIEAHPVGAKVKGRAAVLRHLKAVSVDVSDLDLKLEPYVVSFEHVLYTGTASFGLDTNGAAVAGGVQTVRVPLWVMLRIVDGEIVEQRDFTGLDHLMADLRAGRDG